MRDSPAYEGVLAIGGTISTKNSKFAGSMKVLLTFPRSDSLKNVALANRSKAQGSRSLTHWANKNSIRRFEFNLNEPIIGDSFQQLARRTLGSGKFLFSASQKFYEPFVSLLNEQHALDFQKQLTGRVVLLKFNNGENAIIWDLKEGNKCSEYLKGVTKSVVGLQNLDAIPNGFQTTRQTLWEDRLVLYKRPVVQSFVKVHNGSLVFASSVETLKRVGLSEENNELKSTTSSKFEFLGSEAPIVVNDLLEILPASLWEDGYDDLSDPPKKMKSWYRQDVKGWSTAFFNSIHDLAVYSSEKFLEKFENKMIRGSVISGNRSFEIRFHQE